MLNCFKNAYYLFRKYSLEKRLQRCMLIQPEFLFKAVFGHSYTFGFHIQQMGDLFGIHPEIDIGSVFQIQGGKFLFSSFIDVLKKIRMQLLYGKPDLFKIIIYPFSPFTTCCILMSESESRV